MKKYRLEPLAESEKKFAEENHNLIYKFLHRYGYSIEDFYNIAVFGYLKAVQIYNRREDLRKGFDFPYISWLYMKSEIGNHFRTENARKRKPAETVISLDEDCSESGNLYDRISEKHLDPELEVMGAELFIELLDKLSEVQQKIAKMKIEGYSNKEVYLILGIPSSTYYKEMKRIKAVFETLVG